MAALHAKRGTGAIVSTIYPDSIDVMRKNMEAVRKAIDLQKSIRGVSARLLGVHLEGPFLNPARCGALEEKGFIKPSLSSLKKLIDGYEEIIKIITIAPEIPGAIKVIEKCAELGIKVNMGHSDATYKQALEGKKAGATGITHLFNAMRPFHHVNSGLAGPALLMKSSI
jgi:N-acetylglucosamine-6-phosphate deacetylase